MMFANNSYHSTSPNMFAMCSSRAHLNLENIFRRCQISHWTKLEAPYKGCTVICTFFIKWSSLKIMKFLIENFLFELLAEHFATGITWFRTSTLWLIFSITWLELSRNFEKIIQSMMVIFLVKIFVRKKKVKIRVNLSDIISIT